MSGTRGVRPAFRARYTEVYAAARQCGVTAVPAFVFEGRWAVQGGRDPDTFLSVLEQVAQRTAAVIPAGDACGGRRLRGARQHGSAPRGPT